MFAVGLIAYGLVNLSPTYRSEEIVHSFTKLPV